MKLWIGGSNQGKKHCAMKEYINANWLDETNDYCMGQIKPDKVLIVNHLHLFIKKELEEKKSYEEIKGDICEMISQCREVLIISDEVGCGVVPIELSERKYRETVGRILTELAKEATEVKRFVCGIGMRIK